MFLLCSINKFRGFKPFLFFFTFAFLLFTFALFGENITKKTVIVIDNAPTHTSNIFCEKMEEWKQKNLEFFFLPTYSPQLNLIEILWRFIKYEWLEVSAYESWKHLVESVENILREFGHSYVINFV